MRGVSTTGTGLNLTGKTESAGYADNFAYEPTSARERQIAVAVASVVTLLSIVVAPFARHKLAQQPSFLLLVEAVTVVSLILTGTTLFQHR